MSWKYKAGALTGPDALASVEGMLEALRERGPVAVAESIRESHRRPDPTPEEIAEAEILEEECRLKPIRIFESGLSWEDACSLHDRQLDLTGGDPHAPMRPEILTELEAKRAERDAARPPQLAGHEEGTQQMKRSRLPWEPSKKHDSTGTPPAPAPAAVPEEPVTGTPPPDDNPGDDGADPPRPPASSFTVRELETIRRNADKAIAERTGRDSLRCRYAATSINRDTRTRKWSGCGSS